MMLPSARVQARRVAGKQESAHQAITPSRFLLTVVPRNFVGISDASLTLRTFAGLVNYGFFLRSSGG